jgi:urease accessory protein
VIDLAGPAVSDDAIVVTPGRGEIAVVRSGARSVVCRAYATSPLRLLTPRNHGLAAWIYTSSYGGGLVDGDRLAVRINVGEGAAAYVSTQASSKVYRSPHGTSSETDGRIASNGLLVLAPDPVVCYAGARYRQTQRFELEESASLVALDWMSSGRRAFGERWAFDEYSASLTVRVAGRLIVQDAVVLRKEDGDLADRMRRFEVLAVAVVIGHRLMEATAAIVATAREIPVQLRPDLLVAATPLDGLGCVLRVAGTSTEAVGRTIRAYLGFVPTLLGDDPWARKW